MWWNEVLRFAMGRYATDGEGTDRPVPLYRRWKQERLLRALTSMPSETLDEPPRRSFLSLKFAWRLTLMRAGKCKLDIHICLELSLGCGCLERERDMFVPLPAGFRRSFWIMWNVDADWVGCWILQLWDKRRVVHAPWNLQIGGHVREALFAI